MSTVSGAGGNSNKIVSFDPSTGEVSFKDKGPTRILPAGEGLRTLEKINQWADLADLAKIDFNKLRDLRAAVSTIHTNLDQSVKKTEIGWPMFNTMRKVWKFGLSYISKHEQAVEEINNRINELEEELIKKDPKKFLEDIGAVPINADTRNLNANKVQELRIAVADRGIFGKYGENQIAILQNLSKLGIEELKDLQSKLKAAKKTVQEGRVGYIAAAAELEKGTRAQTERDLLVDHIEHLIFAAKQPVVANVVAAAAEFGGALQGKAAAAVGAAGEALQESSATIQKGGRQVAEVMRFLAGGKPTRKKGDVEYEKARNTAKDKLTSMQQANVSLEFLKNKDKPINLRFLEESQEARNAAIKEFEQKDPAFKQGTYKPLYDYLKNYVPPK